MISVDKLKDMSLYDNAAHVWFGRAVVEADVMMLQSRLRYLDAEELRRYHRYKFIEKRQEFLTGRIFVKTILSRYLDIAPRDIRFRYSPNGMPLLDSGDRSINLRFNLSHSRSAFACAVMLNNPVGIDIEYIRPVEQKHLNPYFTPEEEAYLLERSSAEKLQSIFRVWTLKEAFLKANDLVKGITSTDFYFSFEGPGIKIRGKKGIFPDNWKFYATMWADDFVLALAAGTEDPANFQVQYYCVDLETLCG